MSLLVEDPDIEFFVFPDSGIDLGFVPQRVLRPLVNQCAANVQLIGEQLLGEFLQAGGNPEVEPPGGCGNEEERGH